MSDTMNMYEEPAPYCEVISSPRTKKEIELCDNTCYEELKPKIASVKADHLPKNSVSKKVIVALVVMIIINLLLVFAVLAAGCVFFYFEISKLRSDHLSCHGVE